MNGPSKVCALVTTKCKVYTDPIGVKNELWQDKINILKINILKKGKKQDIPNQDLANQEGNKNIKMHEIENTCSTLLRTPTSMQATQKLWTIDS